jgi:hypothetical protein
MRSAIVNVRGGSTVDQQAKQFRPAVVTSRVHHMLPFVDQREIKVNGDFTFAERTGSPSRLPSGSFNNFHLQSPYDVFSMLCLLENCWQLRRRPTGGRGEPQVEKGLAFLLAVFPFLEASFGNGRSGQGQVCSARRSGFLTARTVLDSGSRRERRRGSQGCPPGEGPGRDCKRVKGRHHRASTRSGLSRFPKIINN